MIFTKNSLARMYSSPSVKGNNESLLSKLEALYQKRVQSAIMGRNGRGCLEQICTFYIRKQETVYFHTCMLCRWIMVLKLLQ